MMILDSGYFFWATCIYITYRPTWPGHLYGHLRETHSI